MTLVCVLIWTLLCVTRGSVGQNVVLSQPAARAVQPGQTAYIDCRANTKVHYSGHQYYLAWYSQKPGEIPKLLIYRTSDRFGETSSRFTGGGSGDGLGFSLTISGVQTADAAVYYCQTYHYINSQNVYTFGGGTRLDVGRDVRPTLTVLPPSGEELQTGTATLMCVANKGFPSDWRLAWKVDGGGSGGEESRSPGVMKDGLYSWTSTLRLTAEQWGKLGSVSCEASQGSQTPLSETLSRDQCSQS